VELGKIKIESGGKDSGDLIYLEYNEYQNILDYDSSHIDKEGIYICVINRNNNNNPISC